MARLIDAEDVLRDKVWFCGGFVSDDFSMGYMEALDKVETVIRNAPTVDAVPVVHGHWVSLTDCSNAGVYCSVCRKKVYTEDYAWANRKNKLRSKFCPNCGALMDLEEEKL